MTSDRSAWALTLAPAQNQFVNSNAAEPFEGPERTPFPFREMVDDLQPEDAELDELDEAGAKE